MEDTCAQVECPLGQRCELDASGREQCIPDWVAEPAIPVDDVEDHSEGAGGLGHPVEQTPAMEALGGTLTTETTPDDGLPASIEGADSAAADVEPVGCSCDAAGDDPTGVWLWLLGLYLLAWRRPPPFRRHRWVQTKRAP